MHKQRRQKDWEDSEKSQLKAMTVTLPKAAEKCYHIK